MEEAFEAKLTAINGQSNGASKGGDGHDVPQANPTNGEFAPARSSATGQAAPDRASLSDYTQSAAVTLLLTIIVLSVVPPGNPPSTPVPHNFEHLAIFLMTGLAFGVGYERRRVALFAAAIQPRPDGGGAFEYQ